jgi:hypothetical protein
VTTIGCMVFIALADWNRARNLMMRDDFKNLGFKDGTKSIKPATKPKSDSDGVKGELRW